MKLIRNSFVGVLTIFASGVVVGKVAVLGWLRFGPALWAQWRSDAQTSWLVWRRVEKTSASRRAERLRWAVERRVEYSARVASRQCASLRRTLTTVFGGGGFPGHGAVCGVFGEGLTTVRLQKPRLGLVACCLPLPRVTPNITHSLLPYTCIFIHRTWVPIYSFNWITPIVFSLLSRCISLPLHWICIFDLRHHNFYAAQVPCVHLTSSHPILSLLDPLA